MYGVARNAFSITLLFYFQKEMGHDVITTECNKDYAQNLRGGYQSCSFFLVI